MEEDPTRETDLEIYSPIDNTVIQGPSLTVRVSGWAQAWVWNPGDQSHDPKAANVIISITDAGSETIPEVEGSFVSPPFNITTPGPKTILVFASHEDLGAAQEVTVHIILDTTPPELTITEPIGDIQRGPNPKYPVRIAGTAVEHRQHWYLKNRVENSHQPTRQREQRMQGVKSPGQAQRFLAAYGPTAQQFRPRWHRFSVPEYRQEIRQRFDTWQEITRLPTTA